MMTSANVDSGVFCVALRSRDPGIDPRPLDEEPERQRQQNQSQDNRHHRCPPASGTVEERAARRRIHARLGRRVAAAIANQRLVGDLGAAVGADHVVRTSASTAGPRPACQCGCGATALRGGLCLDGL